MNDTKLPDHVNPARVKVYDPASNPRSAIDPFAVLRGYHGGPDIFFNPVNFRHGGAWTVTRADLMREVLESPEIFSSVGCAGFSKILGESWDMIPLELDPPEHTAYRRLLNPFFSADKVESLENRMRSVAGHLINAHAKKGKCEFLEAFAIPFPATIMLEILGLPASDLPLFLQWEKDLLHTSDMSVRAAAASKVCGFLRKEIDDCKRVPKQGLISFAANASIEGRPLSNDESLGICFLLFVGGLDTVTASLGYAFKHLAEEPGTRRLLSKTPSLIPHFVEEMLRLHSVVSTRRVVRVDHDFHGVAMKRGDIVECITALGSLDPQAFEEPQCMNLHRSPNRHLAFSAGPHFCIGAVLARREMVVALEEWLQSIPEFEIPENAEIRSHAGVFGLNALPLVWPPATSL